MTMEEKVNQIWFEIGISVISVLIAYLISINMEIGFITLNSPWISNEFCLAVCSGIFTGALVSTIYDIKAYEYERKTVEKEIFNHLIRIEDCLCNIEENIEKFRRYECSIVTVERYQEELKSRANALKNVNYWTIVKYDECSEKMRNYVKQIVLEIEINSSEGILKSLDQLNETEQRILKFQSTLTLEEIRGVLKRAENNVKRLHRINRSFLVKVLRNEYYNTDWKRCLKSCANIYESPFQENGFEKEKIKYRLM